MPTSAGVIILVIIILSVVVLHGLLYLKLDESSSNFQLQRGLLLGSAVSVLFASVLGGMMLKSKKSNSSEKQEEQKDSKVGEYERFKGGLGITAGDLA
jgi:ABC-type Fe3+-siderophore transport system permease subunit